MKDKAEEGGEGALRTWEKPKKIIPWKPNGNIAKKKALPTGNILKGSTKAM